MKHLNIIIIITCCISASQHVYTDVQPIVKFWQEMNVPSDDSNDNNFKYIEQLPKKSQIRQKCLDCSSNDQIYNLCSIGNQLLSCNNSKTPADIRNQIKLQNAHGLEEGYTSFVLKTSSQFGLHDYKTINDEIRFAKKSFPQLKESSDTNYKSTPIQIETQPEQVTQTVQSSTNTAKPTTTSTVQSLQSNEDSFSFTSIINYIFYENWHIVAATTTVTLIAGFLYYKYNSNKAFEEDEDE